ncbi:zona pellucida sperm-binding protein 4-like [Antennarius striatus]|uniref:zona pellucida sperm-binding protein 4-like n=1 Tax=Antennarius striatus TaxID=241820 RepID=UPI0035B376A2
MAGLRLEVLLLVLTGTLLLGPVHGWKRINKTQLFDFSDLAWWDETQGVMSPVVEEEGDGYDEDSVPEYRLSEGEGTATIEDFDFLDEHQFEVEAENSGRTNRVSGAKDGLQVDSEPRPRSWTSSTSQASSELEAVCNDKGFVITLLTSPLSEVKVLGSKDMLLVTDAPESCGYEVDFSLNTLTVPFTGCNVKHIANCYTSIYSLQLLYDDEYGETKVATTSCEEKRAKYDPSLLPDSDCAVATGERVPCGQAGISSLDCQMMGCCVDSNTSTCFYPLDVCTADQQFVFVIRSTSASVPIDPRKLVIPGSPDCKPVIVNDKVAIYKFNVTECGTHSYEVGETMIHLAEVQTVVKALNLKYGIITRSDPLRFMVECRYNKLSSAQQSLASVGYMVKIPPSSLQSSVLANGLYGVQLKIAEDETYSNYYPKTSQPLRLLLGNPVYLELNLLSPKPEAVILVNYCIAYPRSAKNALVMVYKGCANPYDPNVSILQVSDLPTNRHQRRFVVKAFQFMDQKTNKYLDEEIYFMCSSEVCVPTEKTCEERCFDGKTII